MSEADKNSETLPEKKEFSNGQPIKFFIALYALTGGLYIFYWFYKNLKNFTDHETLNQKPYSLLWGYLAFNVFSFILIVLLFFLFGGLETEKLDLMGYSTELFVLVGSIIFTFLLLRKIKSILTEKLDDLFSINNICLLIFLIGAILMFVPEETPYFWHIVLLSAFLTGIIFSVVQKDLNRYWEKEQNHLAIKTSFSKGELIVIGICVISWTYLLSPFPAWSDDESYFEKAMSYTVEINSQIEIPFIEDDPGIFAGAGFLVDKKRGWIVTNAHVTSHSPSKVSISFKGEKFIPGEKIYIDPYLDLAIVKVPPEKISSDKSEAKIKCNGNFKIGHPVGAFGHPWEYPYTGTKGIISGKTSHFGNQLLQTDAPINPGNSGGPLISLKTGEVLAINTSSYDEDEDQNTNFAEQIEFVCRILELLKQGKDPSPPKIPFNFLVDPFKGRTMVISKVYLKNNLIDLKVGDEIVRVIDDGPLENEGDLMHALRGKTENFSLEILRNGTSKVISGKLERHDSVINRKGIFVSGMLISNFWVRDKPVRDLPEFFIHFVQPGSFAEGELITSNMYLDSINGKFFKTLGDLYAYFKEYEDKEIKIRLISNRGSNSNYYLTHYEHSLPVRDLEFIGGVLGEEIK